MLTERSLTSTADTSAGVPVWEEKSRCKWEVSDSHSERGSMMSLSSMSSRRSILKGLAAGSTLPFLPGVARSDPSSKLKGRIKQSVTRGFWRKYSWEEFAKTCAEIGLVGIDLVPAEGWPHLKRHGLAATMVPGAGGIIHGLNELERHDEYIQAFEKNIKAAAQYEWSNVITFSGMRHGMSDEEGLENCHLILKRAVRIAEDHGVTICMELLNSKVDHPGYMCDRTPWGVDLCRRVNSPRFKLLYDIYHMQIMEGDIIRTIRNNIEYIAHFHTAGNPGRQDLDGDQELNYIGIMRAIADLTEEGKFNGYVAHEFGPKHGFDSLRHAVQLCDV